MRPTVMSTEIDLRQLAVDRARAGTAVPARRTPWLTRYVVPGVIVLGFTLLLGWAFRDRLIARKTVQVVPVVVTRADVQRSGTPLFQAAGWIEPRPSAIVVSALADGVVEEMLVVDGQEVTEGQILAKLIEIDAELGVQQAKNAVELCAADLSLAEAELKATQSRKAHPLHLDAGLAEAESLSARMETELGKLPFQVSAALARLDNAKRNFESKREAGDAIPQKLVDQARSDFLAAQSESDELGQREARLKLESTALERRVAALREQRRTLVDETRLQSEAEAKVKACEARRSQARVALEQAELLLKRMIVVAPRAGRVLNVTARPGTRVSGMTTGIKSGEGVILTLYEPRNLQVRADVRIEDVSKIVPGQKVLIETAAIKQTLNGTVLQTTSSANIQKNTLEVKVGIESPPSSVRPEMLVTTTFLAPETDAENSAQTVTTERLLIPKKLLQTREGGSAVWIVAPEGMTTLRTIRVGKAETDHLVEVLDGLTPTDKLVESGQETLREGEVVLMTEKQD